MQVSVRELKDNLSKYLRLIRTGQTVLITSHRRPLAELKPVEALPDADLEDFLSSPGIRWNGKRPKGAHVKLKKSKKQVSDMVLEDRR